jgi:hypothetical protein
MKKSKVNDDCNLKIVSGVDDSNSLLRSLE